MRRRLWAAATVWVAVSALHGQVTKTDAELDEEAKQAETLRAESRLLDALPLYEDLHRERPKRVDYTERLAMAYVMKMGAATTPADKLAARDRARALFAEAKAAGDHSDLLEIVGSQLEAASRETPPDPASAPAGQAILNQAEVLFAKGDLAGAMALYTRAWQENPKLYAAPLFAGDAEYKQNHYAEAGVWFARAIAIDPNRETAYRYWADCLMKAGKTTEARQKYVEALVAEPYTRAPRLVLRTWAERNHLRYVPPPIVIPIAMTKQADGSFKENIDPARMKDPNYLAWIPYPLHTAAWQSGKFAKTYPQEKTYRHSLAEEAEAMHTLLAVQRNSKDLPPERYDATLRSLAELEKDGMLECWILLDNPDQGVAQDYAAYRAAHHDLLIAYVNKYDLHPSN